MGSNGYEVMWNQMIANGDFSQGIEGWYANVSTISVDDNILTAIPTTDGSNAQVQRRDFSSQINDIYYTRFDFRLQHIDGKACAVSTVINLNNGSTYFVQGDITSWLNYVGFIKIVNNDLQRYVISYNMTSCTKSCDIKNVICINLTTMFGQGNEPPTADQFELWLTENSINPDSYIPYDAGTPRLMTKPSWIQ